MRKTAVVAVAVWLLGCPERAQEQQDAGAAASSAPSASASAPASVSAAPSASATPSATASATTSASASASAAPDEGPPTWLKLAPGESIKEHIASGSTKGCYAVKGKGRMEEIRCPPVPPPGATVDELDIDAAHSCPPGFEVGGANFCARTCRRDSDCHAKHVCEPGVHQCIRK